MFSQEIIYAPCPCGSGKKFKFCCFQKYRNQLDSDMTLAEITQFIRCEKAGVYSDESEANSEVMALIDEGYDLMLKGDFALARLKFRRGREIDPGESAAWNNEASCAWEMGDYADACDLQREGNARSRCVDAFGLARLAIYAHTTGLEDEAAKALAAALAVPPISVDGAVETCNALALYHRHRDILDYVAKSGMADSPRLAVFTGLARANLCEIGQAELNLGKGLDTSLAPMVERYLDMMADDFYPLTTCEDDKWPYFDIHNFAPARFFAEDLKKGVDPFARCPAPIALDCIVFLLADCTITVQEALEFVRKLPGDRAGRIAVELEEIVRSEEEEDARRANDKDAHGNQRAFFYTQSEDVESWLDELSDDELELFERASDLSVSQIEPGDSEYVSHENAIRDLAAAHPHASLINMTYFHMVERHDPKLAHDLMKSYFALHPDNVRIGGALLADAVRERDYATCAEILDHFAIPEEELELTDCAEWGFALLALHALPDFKEAQPAAYERLCEFVKMVKIPTRRQWRREI